MVYTISGRNLEIVKDEKQTVSMEIFASFVASLPFLTFGIQSTSLSSSAHAGHFVTTEGVPWSTNALVMTTMVTAPVFSYIVNRLGRKSGIFIITLTQAASLVPLFFFNSTNTIILHVLAGAASGGLFTVIPAYIVEVTSSSARGVCMKLMMAMTTAGYMTSIVMTLEERMYLMTGLVMLQAGLMLCVHESPGFLMMTGKVESSKKTLSKLKRLPEDSPNLLKAITMLLDECERAKARGKVTVKAFYRDKVWWDSFKIGFVLYTCIVFCGSILFLDQGKTLAQLKLTHDPDNKLVLCNMFAGTLTSLVLVSFLDRKYILTAGCIIMAISSGVLAVFTQKDLTVTSVRWLPMASLGTLIFGHGMAWGLPVVILAEVFNIEVRTTILSLLFSYSQAIKLAHVHTFKLLEEHVGIYTLLYIFAIINLYGAVYALFVVPKIKNKSLRQIHRQLKRKPLPA